MLEKLKNMNTSTENQQIMQNVRNLCYCSGNNPSNFEIPAGYKIVFLEIESEDAIQSVTERYKEFDFDFMDTLINYWFPRSAKISLFFNF